MKLLNTDKNTFIISNSELVKCFSDILMIKTINTKILENMKKIFEGKQDDKKIDTIGKLFVFSGPALKIYSNYINNYEDISKHLKSCLKSNKKFETIIKVTEKKSKILLRDLMIIQRIPSNYIKIIFFIKIIFKIIQKDINFYYHNY
jgi:hypothetical protein